MVALVDSVHFKEALPPVPGQAQSYSSEANSILDKILQPLATARERSYSEPLAAVGFRKETFEREGLTVRDYPRLRFGGKHLSNPTEELSGDVWRRTLFALAWGLFLILVSMMASVIIASFSSRQSVTTTLNRWFRGQTEWPWRSIAITFAVMVLVVCWVAILSQAYHVFGTDRTGNSVLVFALKSVRTALVIGGLTTLVVLPLALLLGVTAGYLRG